VVLYCRAGFVLRGRCRDAETFHKQKGCPRSVRRRSFLRHSLREAGYLAKFDFLNEATLKKQLRQHGKIQHVWQGWNFANRKQLCQVGKHQKLNVDKL
jgi:hypothetical protein